eukprot:tig00000459_g1129.t1
MKIVFCYWNLRALNEPIDEDQFEEWLALASEELAAEELAKEEAARLASKTGGKLAVAVAGVASDGAPAAGPSGVLPSVQDDGEEEEEEEEEDEEDDE